MFALLMRALNGTWLQPGSFFALFWCFAGIIPLIFAPQERVEPNVFIWLLAASAAVSLGGAVGNGGLKTKISLSPSPATDRELTVFSLLLVGAIVLGLGSSLAFLRASSIGVSELFNLEKLVVTANETYIRQSVDASAPPPPPLSQALLVFVYLAPAVGGVVFELRRERLWKLVALASFLPPVAVTILQTTKAAVLWSMSLWLSCYFATRLRRGNLKVFTAGHTLVAVVVGGFLGVFFVAVSLARLATTDTSLINFAMIKLASAAFGHMTVFSQWLADYTSHSIEPTLGSVTLAGPLEMFGVGHRVPGMFDSLIELVTGETSNIYTGFRPLIQDFTIPGALLILALLGFVGGVGFRLVAIGRWSGMPLLLAAYVTIFWMPVTWFWLYNSLTASVVAVGLIVFFVRLWRGIRPGVLQGEQVGSTS